MSHIEWVVLHALGKNYPEAYDYIMYKALERGGDLDCLNRTPPGYKSTQKVEDSIEKPPAEEK